MAPQRPLPSQLCVARGCESGNRGPRGLSEHRLPDATFHTLDASKYRGKQKGVACLSSGSFDTSTRYRDTGTRISRPWPIQATYPNRSERLTMSASTRKWIRAAAAVFFAIGVSACLTPPLAAQDQSSAVRPPKLDFTTHTLSNGLQVILLEDHAVPVIDLQVWYHVGG